VLLLLFIIFLILNVTFLSYFVVVKGEGKVYPRSFSFTWALGGVGSQRHAPAALLMGKNPSSHWLRGRVGSKPVWNHEKYDKCTQNVANEVTLKSKLKNNIEMDLKDQGCKNLGWIRLIQNRYQW